MELDTKRVTVVKGLTTRAENVVKGLEIKTQADYDKAGQQYITLKKLQKDFLAEEREWLDPLNKLRNKIFSYTRPARLKIAEAVEVISNAMFEYENKVEAERQAKAKEIEEKVDSGEMKLAEATNAVSNMDNIEQVQTDKGKIGQRFTYELVVTDVNKVERQFLVPDILELKKAYQVSGVVPLGCELKQNVVRTTRLK